MSLFLASEASSFSLQMLLLVRSESFESSWLRFGSVHFGYIYIHSIRVSFLPSSAIGSTFAWFLRSHAVLTHCSSAITGPSFLFDEECSRHFPSCHVLPSYKVIFCWISGLCIYFSEQPDAHSLFESFDCSWMVYCP